MLNRDTPNDRVRCVELVRPKVDWEEDSRQVVERKHYSPLCPILRPVSYVFGQSAGGHAVRMLLSCPAASGLFHRAILQSGGSERFAFDTSRPNEKTYAASEALIAHVGGCGAEELRRVPTEVIKEASYLYSGVALRNRISWLNIPPNFAIFLAL